MTEFKEIEEISIEGLKSGSTALVLEAAVAMETGKLQPVGYEQVADFFRNEKGRTTPAHNAWLLVEAKAAGRLEEAKKEFPDSEQLAQLVVRDMQQNHPDLVAEVMNRVSCLDWTIGPAIGQQEQASQLFRTLFTR